MATAYAGEQMPALNSMENDLKSIIMKASEILTLPSMPMASPSYPRGPYRFIDREYVIVTYESDPDAIRDALSGCEAYDDRIL
jgi:hypothetical protein